MKRISLLLLVLLGLFTLVSCGAGPGKTVERFFRDVEAGEITDALSRLSSNSIQTLGEEKWRALLTQATADINDDGGFDDINIVSEDVTGETAEVEVEFTYGNGDEDSETFDLVEEDGDWKIQIDPYSK